MVCPLLEPEPKCQAGAVCLRGTGANTALKRVASYAEPSRHGSTGLGPIGSGRRRHAIVKAYPHPALHSDFAALCAVLS